MWSILRSDCQTHITFFISRGDRSPILVWPVLSRSSLKFLRRNTKREADRGALVTGRENIQSKHCSKVTQDCIYFSLHAKCGLCTEFIKLHEKKYNSGNNLLYQLQPADGSTDWHSNCSHTQIYSWHNFSTFIQCIVHFYILIHIFSILFCYILFILPQLLFFKFYCIVFILFF